ncbi:MAG: glycosyltransferase family 1 protein [Spartobacteria bacterium]|nr:glycosyltransferase family 1 protein [Spartobacteria bacterium]
MNTKSNILFLSDHLGHDHGRIHGATSYFLSVLPKIDPSRFCVTVVFLRTAHASAQHLEDEGLHPLFLNKGKWDISVLRDLVQLIRKHDIHVVHAAGMKGILAGRWAAHHCGVKCIAHFHDMKKQSLPIYLLHRMTALWTHCGLAVSRAVGSFATDYFHIPSDRVKVLYNGIDLSQFLPISDETRIILRTALNIKSQDHVLISVGRMDTMKNQAEALRVLQEIHKTHPQTKLLLVGSGSLESTLKDMATGMQLDQHVIFTGQRTDVSDLLAISDVMVMTSIKEGLGLAAVEALATGLPVVCTAVGGLPEVVKNGVCGFLTTPGKTNELAGRVCTLLEDTSLYNAFSEKARIRAQLFDIRTHMQHLQEIYTELAGRSL